MPKRIALLFAAVALALLPLFGGAAYAKSGSLACGESPYSYAGIIGRQASGGIMATVELTAGPAVAHGHVAAWVGVGGSGLGPGGTNEWLQVGFAATDSVATKVYYEVAQPHATPRFVALTGVVTVGQHHRVGVIEMVRRPNWWRVWLDGDAVTGPIHLGSSHARWAPVATSESWNGGVQSCNGFGYRFLNIRSSGPRRKAWGPLTNAYPIDAPGYSVRMTAAAGLVVAGGDPQPALEPPVLQTPVPGSRPPIVAS